MGAAAVLGVGVPILSACGSGSSPSGTGAVQSGIADGLKPEAGPLKIYNYADYIAPDVISKFEDEHKVKIEVTTFATEQEAINKLANKAVNVDVLQSASESQMVRLINSGLAQPLNRSYIPNFDTLLSPYDNPSYDPGARFSVPMGAWSLGIGYRTDRIPREEIESQGWNILGDQRFRGQAAVLDDYRNTLGYQMLINGHDVNSGDDAVIEEALNGLLTLADRSGVKVNSTQYQDIPEGNTTVSLIWSTDIMGAVPYLPQGTSAEVLGWWYPSDKISIVGTDLASVMTSAASPVLAHMWVNYMLDPQSARRQFVNNGVLPPIKGLEPAALADEAGLPPLLASAIYTSEIAEKGVRQKELSVDVDRKWEDAWSTFTSR